ncbi:hypothetical protein HU200_040142 [Digitaria exilis]|uniref:HMA domain-containing protein n=1 Tax=Digitaria exilis TaxID=1010633 RepID=A0A835B862_9POAL|nr:hypothetical protein HU200_040142 [Digitaria exilis]CAB3451509.1 unnamed protein product [Digitaria exilis]
MGKKKGGNNNKQGQAAAAPKGAFVLRVPMHCRCDGCADKIRAGVKDLMLHHDIEALDQSALWTKGELRVASSTADPDKLRRRLKKATGKSVDLLLPKPPAADKDAAAAAKDATAAAMEALLRRSIMQQQQQQAEAHQYGGGHGQVVLPAAWGAALQQQQQQPGYPWAGVQVQHHQPVAEAAYYPSSYGLAAAYPAADWGAYAYPPAAPHGGGAGYGGGWLY